MPLGRLIGRKRRHIKRPSPEDYAEYMASAASKRSKMEKFDRLPPEVRQALANVKAGGISIDDITDYIRAGMSPATMAVMIERTAAMILDQERRRYEAEMAAERKKHGWLDGSHTPA